jgi:lipoprotein NlpI
MQHVSLLQHEIQHLTQRLAADPHNPGGYVQRGMRCFQLGDMVAAIADFDRAERLDPTLTPRLWQRGLAYYYAGRFEDGARQFTIDLTVNRHDVEETVWRYLCQAQVQGAPAARAALYPVRQDARPVMGWIYRLFAGECSAEVVLAQYDSAPRRERFYSQLYAGLYFEAAQEPEQARSHIVQAAEMQVVEDYMGWVARVHQRLRGWAKS